MPPEFRKLWPVPACRIGHFRDPVRGALLEAPESGLQSLLKEKGVLAQAGKDRATHVLNSESQAKVQAAMQTPNAWKELKALANQHVPPVQLVLPSELDMARLAAAKDGRLIISKRKPS